MFVVDSTDRERIDVARDQFHIALADEVCPLPPQHSTAHGDGHSTHGGCDGGGWEQQLKDAAVLVFANKQDARGAMSAAEISQRFALHTLKDHEWHIEPCCALTGQGLEAGIDWLAQRLRPSRG